MSDQKIVSLKPPLDKPPLTVVKEDYSDCQHPRYEVHHTFQKVWCADCDADLDPLWVLRKIAGDHRQRDYHIETLKRESEKLAKLLRRSAETRRKPERRLRDEERAARHEHMAKADPAKFRGNIALTDDAGDGGAPEDGEA